ncbi:hypothetical protein B005_0068 [Nocardiopsis alba ATCC BAA-2165]|uniref:Uncharacterized protein n=1 Tax=Nocardiopsis alba (strain ATCC BAA-2165 / BE74) TaxID=1205910 RepID=J7LAR7_NOCAA|nr:hypothetical protein B005_0068 [Nocardiopsis alba ATCC BAA-2165]
MVGGAFNGERVAEPYVHQGKRSLLDASGVVCPFSGRVHIVGRETVGA